jgi:hypothetical protein
MLISTRSAALALSAALMSAAAASPQCDQLTASDDGVPAAYYQAACKGTAALRARSYKAAESHFRQALSEVIFEALNFELKAELGWSLCRQGKKTEGRKELGEFICMAEAELGKRQCWPDHPMQRSLPKPSSQLCAEICDSTMSGLNEGGIKLRETQLRQARSWAKRCEA